MFQFLWTELTLDQADLAFADNPPAPASYVLGLMSCAATTTQLTVVIWFFK